MTDTRDVSCAANAQLVSDDRLPAQLKATFDKVDQCLKPSAPPSVAASYVPASCGGLESSNYRKVVNAGPDKCSKEVPATWVHTPGVFENSNIIGSPTAQEANLRSVTCPANARLREEDGKVFCER